MLTINGGFIAVGHYGQVYSQGFQFGPPGDWGTIWPRRVDFGNDDIVYYVPFWMAVLSAGILMTVLWITPRRLIRPGHCRKCGYDLTGDVSGICPECGTSCESKPAEARLRGGRD